MTEFHRRTLIGGAAATAAFGALPSYKARAQAANTIKIGVMNDQSGLYRDISGPGSTVAVRQAVSELGQLGFNVEVVQADHQNRPDVGATVVRQWIDRDGVDVIIDVPTSSVALAVNQIVREKNKVFLNSGAATSDLTGSACSANTIHWTYDTYMLARGTGGAMVRAGGDTWFFITADYAFGHALERDASAIVKEKGGQVLGAVRHPIASADFSSYLVQAQASKAQVIGLANGSGDTINTMKQAREFGVGRGAQRVAALYMGITDVHSMGLNIAQDVNLVEAFYWDQNAETRKWSERFFKMAGRMPSGVQASNYAATMHYLNAVKAAGTDAAGPVLKKMHETKINDFMTKDGYIREDGRVMRDLYLYKVKKPSESKRTWDYYNVVRTIPAAQAFRAPDPSCPLVKK